MRKRLLLFCTLAFLAVFSASANPIRLTLALEPAQTLPGIPVTFRVTALNTGTTPAPLPTWVRMELTSGRAPSILFPGSRGEEDMAELPLLGDRPSVVLEPGQELKLDYVASPSSPPWFCDERLQRPGTYRLRLRADRVLSGSRWVASPDPIVSNEVELTIAQPTGVDAEAFAIIGEDTGCLGWSDEKSELLWSRYPDSVYTSLSVRPTPRYDDLAEVASMQATLARNPPAGFADAIKQSIANRYIMFMEDAVTDGDVQKAFEHSEAARVIFEELATKDTDAYIKAAAQQSLRIDVMTLEELKDYEARNRSFAPPRPKCEAEQVAAVRTEVAQAASGSGISAKARTKLEVVLRSLDAYAAELAKRPPSMSRALHELRGAVTEIENLSRVDVNADQSRLWQSGLANAAAMSAKKAVDTAVADAAVRTKTLEQAKDHLAEAEAAKQDADYRTAIRLYKAALDKAENASKARGSFC